MNAASLPEPPGHGRISFGFPPKGVDKGVTFRQPSPAPVYGRWDTPRLAFVPGAGSGAAAHRDDTRQSPLRTESDS
jgi:hypothetical protein